MYTAARSRGRGRRLAGAGMAAMLAGAVADGRAAEFFRIEAPTDSVITAISADGTLSWSNAAPGVECRVQRTSSPDAISNWTDFARVACPGTTQSSRMVDPGTPAGMVFIPGGRFDMGDAMAEGDGQELPVHSVFVSAMYVDRYAVDNTKMAEALQWAYDHVPPLISVDTTAVRNAGGNVRLLMDLVPPECRIAWNPATETFAVKAERGAGHPCVYVSWFGACAYGNFRSLMEGLTPCYDFADWSCDWSASGYRLPTEAEWEKAARGGPAGHRFAWSDDETIQHARANYYSWAGYGYDTSATRGYHPVYAVGGAPWTAPVDAFAPNGYGLCNTIGNVHEWCGDWHNWDYYQAYPTNGWPDDPRGPADGGGGGETEGYVVMRGGGYSTWAIGTRVFKRDHQLRDSTSFEYGFRTVRRAAP